MFTPREFMDALWQGVAGGVAVVRVFGHLGEAKAAPKDLFFDWPSEADSLISALAAPGAGTAYIGAGLRSERSTGRDFVSGVAAFWTSINLREVPIERAGAALKAFPAKPSAGILVGDTLHAVWFLREVLSGEDLDLAWAANRTIVQKLSLGGANAHFDGVLLREGLQGNHYDFDGLLRAPGQPGAKPVAWRPEARYGVEEFTDIVCPKRHETVPPTPAETAAAPPEAAPAPVAPPSAKSKKVPSFELTTEALDQIKETLKGVWFEGGTGHMARCVAGMFAKSGVVIEQAKEAVAEGVAFVGGDVQRRIADVEVTYRRLEKGEAISGSQALDILIDNDFHENRKKDAHKAVKEIMRKLPRKGVDADFEIVRIIKFDSRPARYIVMIRKSGQEKDYEVPCEIETFTKIKLFRTAFTEATPDNQSIASIKQTLWEEMFGAAPCEVRTAPQEATTSGSIKAKLEGFLEEKKENPELGDLKTFPGYTEKEVYFQLDAFRRRLRDAGVKASDREITHVLHDDGWTDIRRWVGNKNPRLWVKAIMQGGSGNGNGSGHGHDPEPTLPTKSEPKQVIQDLFEVKESPPAGQTVQSEPVREPGEDRQEDPFADGEDH